MGWRVTKNDVPVGPFDMTEDEIKTALRVAPTNTAFNYGDYLAELDRRARNRQARATNVLSVVGAIIALVALLLAAQRLT